MRRIVGAGLGMMAAVALAAALWPMVAGVVTALLVTVLISVLCAAAGVLAVLGGRRVRARRAWRRERHAELAAGHVDARAARPATGERRRESPRSVVGGRS
ncbi:MAG: hypothetical protein AB7V42_16780 [Thermoleophilia bacterium]